MKEKLVDILKETEWKTASEILNFLSSSFEKVTFSTSFGKEDQVITHLISNQRLPIEIFTLDTGRLFEEAYEVFHRTKTKFKIDIKVFFPEKNEVEKLLQQKGPYSFYDSVENRKECCRIRKIEPLKRAIKGQQIWITGLRREQSDNRSEMKIAEWDEINQIIKVHPIFEWTEKEVDDYCEKFNVPVNALHKKNFPSIGCAPCTRAIQPGEDFRAGRWWWEQSKKECGLHS